MFLSPAHCQVYSFGVKSTTFFIPVLLWVMMHLTFPSEVSRADEPHLNPLELYIEGLNMFQCHTCNTLGRLSREIAPPAKFTTYLQITGYKDFGNP
ncbi:MAG TPA: hypothetical protein GX509_08270 [Firmicutes bacterium]|nr:hypothetical protein [Bacillota bacterium]HHY98717.1 hypothetical protein [Bacillota bacterium]